MTFPPGGEFTPTDYGVSKGGAIPGMRQRTQANVETQLKSTVGDGRWGQIDGGIFAIIAAAIGAILGGFGTVLEAIFGTVDNSYIEAMPIINDHSQQLADLESAFQQLILQGNALVFTDGELYVPSEGVLSLDVILVGAGAGGGGGRGDVIPVSRAGGGGGGGGGEVHVNIPASLLPTNPDGTFQPIAIGIGAFGAGGAPATNTNAAPGHGGGNTTFGSWLTAGGGQGGTGATESTGGIGGLGGAGMIPGGAGGRGAGGGAGSPGVTGGNSTSAFDLHGGGGGGGGGGGNAVAGNGVGTAGGIGGISPGGQPGGEAGTEPSEVVATGAGGGGGGNSTQQGGAGGYPGGGGGGGGENARGGDGANGIAYVIERFT
ncbi:glycine-rich domain-containing protein [Nocardia farcinica]|uniref:glycine-rich domain-containing protein n=1 Tax=Nocardia farcinica TaxID=37329 RepID=UPI0018946A4B|nr:hypothetical protein [Nocardia farcinica]MBF6315060.1 hypothetical protein [Nocardia farcinica]